MLTFISGSEEQTRRFAEEYAKTLKDGDVVLLFGDLGAGKTAFVKGLAAGLGIESEVVSPTYTYLNVYGGRLYHYDCYRLSCGEDALALGLADYFGENNVCAVEWPQNIASVLPAGCKKVTIEKLGENERKITAQ